jgi:hypothetical protein
LWYPVSADWLAWPRPPADSWLLSGGLVSLAYWAFTWLGPRLAFVKVGSDHLRVQTPIYRLTVSFRRVAGTRPVEFARLFPPVSLPRGLRGLAQSYFRRTALGVNLNGFPLPVGVLRLFLNPLFFAPDEVGLVLLVEDWMGLSSTLTANLDAWRQGQKPRASGRHGLRGILDAEEEEA